MTIYRERLAPAPWVLLVTALVIPAALLVFLPIDALVGAITGAVLYLGCVTILVGGAPVIEVTGERLRAGRASIPLRFVAESRAFVGDEASLERGQRLDARAWLLIRGWIRPVVRIELDDPSDPTPYWLVSTRRPDQLSEALRRATSGD